MPVSTPARRVAALLSLSLGGFAIGLTEFVAMGLLPDVARGVLPNQYQQDSVRAVAHAGTMISTYALGVVVGAPLFTVLGARVSRTRLLYALLAIFVAGTVASAAAPTFGLLLAARFVAALPHGAYFGAAGLVAATILGPGSRARGVAMVLSGLTVANVVGVPAITRLGQTAGWRVAYLAIAAIFALTLVAVAVTVPRLPADPTASARGELAAFRHPQVWLVAAVAALGFGGFFAVDSYITEVTTRVAGQSSAMVPWVLAAIGLGMTVGNAAGGWAADRDLRRSLLIGIPVSVAVMVAFVFAAPTLPGLLAAAFGVGATCMFGVPALQSRLIQVAPGAPMMGAAVSQSSMNIANSLGALLGGLVIGHGYGFLAPAWVGAGLGTLGFLLISASYAAEAARHRCTAAGPVPDPEPATLAG